MDIVPYEARFRDAVAGLWYDSFESAGLSHDAATSAATLANRLDDEIAHHGWQVYLARRDVAILGFLAFEPAQAYLHQLFIARHAQGQGVGKALLNFAKCHMPRGFHLRTDVQNTGARRFYEREGLTLESVAPHPRFHHMTATYRWR